MNTNVLYYGADATVILIRRQAEKNLVEPHAIRHA